VRAGTSAVDQAPITGDGTPQDQVLLLAASLDANSTHPLAQADIGFAMGAAGSDTAIETADVASMDDDHLAQPGVQLQRHGVARGDAAHKASRLAAIVPAARRPPGSTKR
jgi:cation transport ATPase